MSGVNPIVDSNNGVNTGRVMPAGMNLTAPMLPVDGTAGGVSPATHKTSAPAQGASGNTITGTPGNDYLLDTAANDTMLGGDGNDVFHMSWGSDDVVDGQGGDYNQVDFIGRSSDYTFSKAADGSVIVKTSVGETDILRNIDGVYFYGDNKWMLIDDLFSTDGATVAGTPGNDYLLDTPANDIMLGGDGNDVFDLRNGGDDTVDGQTGDYNQVDVQGGVLDYKFVQKENGDISMIGPDSIDTLKNIDGVYFYGDNKWYSMADLVAPQPGNEIVGTSGNDYLLDTAADDVMLGGNGLDVFDLRQGGNDVVDGQGGDYNQVDLQGASSDYTFVTGANGDVTMTRGQEIDTLKNIDGVYFYGENKWYAIADLIGKQPGNVINGTPGNDYLIGTPENDVMNGGDGVDVFRSSRGDDVINGGAGYNQVDYDGKAADYQISKSADGAYHVSNSTFGNDTLRDIGGLWFSGENKWYTIDQLAGQQTANVIRGTAGDDVLSGTDGNDIIYAGAGRDRIMSSPGDDVYYGEADSAEVRYEGKSSDYVVTKGSDGAYHVANAVSGYDTLHDISSLGFIGEQKSYSIDFLVVDEPAPMAHDMGM